MIGDGGVAPPIGRTGVAGDPNAVVEDLDRSVVDACIDEFTDEAIRGGIPVSVDLDMIVRGNTAALPARKMVRLVGQFGELGFVDFGE